MNQCNNHSQLQILLYMPRKPAQSYKYVGSFLSHEWEVADIGNLINHTTIKGSFPVMETLNINLIIIFFSLIQLSLISSDSQPNEKLPLCSTLPFLFYFFIISLPADGNKVGQPQRYLCKKVNACSLQSSSEKIIVCVFSV